MAFNYNNPTDKKEFEEVFNLCFSAGKTANYEQILKEANIKQMMVIK